MSFNMISSASNDKIKHVAKLVRSSSLRKEEGLFIAEGERICKEVTPDRFVEGYVSEEYLLKNGIKGASGYASVNGCDYTVVSKQVYKKISDTVSGQGILCVVKNADVDPMEYLDTITGDCKLLLLESIQDPGNLGTMIRTAEAAGFDAIITDNNTVDVYNPKVIRSTMGGIFRMKVMRTEDFTGLLRYAKSKGVRLYGAILEGSVDFKKCEYNSCLGILIGNEGNGLSSAVRDIVDVKVSIPMAGKVESLNAAVAAALFMYEAR